MLGNCSLRGIAIAGSVLAFFSFLNNQPLSSPQCHPSTSVPFLFTPSNSPTVCRIKALREKTYSINQNSGKDRPSHGRAILRIIRVADHGVVIRFEEGADDREDYDGETGDDDAVRRKDGCQIRKSCGWDMRWKMRWGKGDRTMTMLALLLRRASW